MLLETMTDVPTPLQNWRLRICMLVDVPNTTLANEEGFLLPLLSS
jgi:hypothetical protein